MMSPPAEVYDPPRHRASTGEVLGNAMVLTAAGQPLQAQKLIWRKPRSGQVLLKIHACGVCRTDLHVVDGELPHPKLPLVPGHEVIAMVAAVGDGVERFGIGDRVGVPAARCPVLLRDPLQLFKRGRCTADVCGTDRIPGALHGGRWEFPTSGPP